MGSGPTAVAALRTGRAYVGIELELEWFRKEVLRVKRELMAIATGRGELLEVAAA